MVVIGDRFLLPTMQSDIEEFVTMASKFDENKAIIVRALNVLEKSMVRALRKHQDEGLTAMADLVKKEVEKLEAAKVWITEMKDEGKPGVRG